MVGGASTVMHAGLTHAAVAYWLLPATRSTIYAYLLTVPVNFLLQRIFTFRSRQSFIREIPRYLFVHGIGLLTAYVATRIVVDLMGAHYYWGIATTMIAIPVIGFICMNFWVFRANTGDAAEH